jgi:hypothetical protein
MIGGLIEMNAHMVVTQNANTMIVGGMILGVVFMTIAIAIIMTPDMHNRLRRAAIFCLLAAAFATVAIIGANQPRVKEIRCCASGPVSLEMVAGLYDIVEIDGKELTLRQR